MRGVLVIGCASEGGRCPYFNARGQQCVHRKGHACGCEAPPDLTNDAPRRRTEPALPPVEPFAFAVGDRVRYHEETLAQRTGTVVGVEGDIVKVQWEGSYACSYARCKLRMVAASVHAVRTEPAITVPADDRVVVPAGRLEITFQPTCEAENVFRIYRSWHGTNAEEAYTQTLKAYGAQQYADVALSIAQTRELLAVEEAKAEMEAWRLRNGPWLDWLRDSDHDGMHARAVAAFADEERAWLDALTPPCEGETLGDWVARMPPRLAGPFEGREYMQHLFDKLAKGEVVGG